MFPIVTSTISINCTLINFFLLETNSQSPCKWMVGRRSFPSGSRPIFRGVWLLVLGRVHLKVFTISFTWKWWMVSKVGLSCFEGLFFQVNPVKLQWCSMTNPEISLKVIPKTKCISKIRVIQWLLRSTRPLLKIFDTHWGHPSLPSWLGQPTPPLTYPPPPEIRVS